MKILLALLIASVASGAVIVKRDPPHLPHNRISANPDLFFSPDNQKISTHKIDISDNFILNGSEEESFIKFTP